MTKIRTITASLLWQLLAGIVALASAQSGSVYQLHGSGTTNLSKCFWLIMQQFMDRAKLPLHMTYRAVGSSTGQAEFKGNSVDGVGNTPSNDFGAGDIPISTGDYNELVNAGVEFVQLPFVMGAVSVFHGIPGVPDGSGGLNLTPCLLARIFAREITEWDDTEITDINPGLAEKLPSAGYAINVARRRLGSSSTASITTVSTGLQTNLDLWMAMRIMMMTACSLCFVSRGICLALTALYNATHYNTTRHQCLPIAMYRYKQHGEFLSTYIRLVLVSGQQRG